MSLLLSRARTREHALYLLLLLFLPTQFGKHFWPDYAHILGFRVDYLSPTLYTSDILLFLLFLHWVIRIKVWQKLTVHAVLPYLLVLLFLLMTIVPAHSVLSGLYSLLKFSEFLFFGWYTAMNLSEKTLRQWAVRIFVFTLTASGLLAILQVLRDGSLGGMLYFVGERAISSLTPGAATAVLNGEVYLRPYATFPHPNVLGGFLLLSMVFLFLQRKLLTSRFNFALLVISFGIGTLGLLGTLSRLPIALWGILGSIGAFQFMRAGMLLKQKGQIFMSILFIMALGFMLSVFPVISRFLGTSLGEEAVLVRTDLNKSAIQVISEHPVLGVGLGNGLFATAALRDMTLPLFFSVQPVHNIFLLSAVETGLLGLVLLLWFLARTLHVAGTTGRILLSLILFLGLFDHYFFTLQQGQLLLSFFLGFAWAEKRLV